MIPRPLLRLGALATLALASFVLTACPGGKDGDKGDGDKQGVDLSATLPDDPEAANAEILSRYAGQLDVREVTYRWDPAVGDSSVSAEDGGPGFTGEGWETNMTFPAIGAEEAVRGGTMRRVLYDWPATLRLHGENYNTAFNYEFLDLAGEGLLSLHPTTLEFIPSLATHWQISEDKRTYRFRINPAARWADGSEVTAADVVATYKLRMDPKCRFPSSPILWGKFHEPVAKSKYILEVTVKQDNWRNFLYMATSVVFPAEYVSMPGDEFLDKYQNSYFPLAGAYEVLEENIQKGESIVVTRRDDWWREGDPSVAGTANFDRIEYYVVRDMGLAYEKLKKGEFDYYVVPKAQWWAEDVPYLDQVARGLLQPLKVYNDAPHGTSGIALNMAKPPLDDVRVRKALQLLYDRELFIEKLFFNEYDPLTSYWQGGMYQNEANEYFEYDPVAAVELLEQAGWQQPAEGGYRTKDGKTLKLEVIYRSKFSERDLTIYQDACKDAGIQLEIRFMTPASHWKDLTEKNYEMASTAWGALVFPNPESSWKGELAGQPGNNNVTAFNDPAVDELLAAYDAAYDVATRTKVMKEIDGKIYNQHPYVLGWFNPAHRVLYWNKFGMPKWASSRTADADELWYTWWIDPEKEAALEAARADANATMEHVRFHHRWWQAWRLTNESK